MYQGRYLNQFNTKKHRQRRKLLRRPNINPGNPTPGTPTNPTPTNPPPGTTTPTTPNLVQPPDDVTLTAGDSAITARWTASPTTGVTGYVVYLNGARVADVAANVRVYTFSPLANGTRYSVQLEAKEGTDVSAKTAPEVATPQAVNTGQPVPSLAYDGTFNSANLPEGKRLVYQKTVQLITKLIDGDTEILEYAKDGNGFCRRLSTQVMNLYILYHYTRDKAIILLMADIVEGYSYYLRMDKSKNYIAYDGTTFGKKSQAHQSAELQPFWNDLKKIRKYVYIRPMAEPSDDFGQGTDLHTHDLMNCIQTLISCMRLFDINRNLSRGTGKISLGTMADEWFAWWITEFHEMWNRRGKEGKRVDVPLKQGESSHVTRGSHDTKYNLINWKNYISHDFMQQQAYLWEAWQWCVYRDHSKAAEFERLYRGHLAFTQSGAAFIKAPNGKEIVVYGHHNAKAIYIFKYGSNNLNNGYSSGAHLSRYSYDIDRALIPLTVEKAVGFADKRFAGGVANQVTMTQYYTDERLSSRCNGGNNKFVDGSALKYPDTWPTNGLETSNGRLYVWGSADNPEFTNPKTTGTQTEINRIKARFRAPQSAMTAPFDPTSDYANIKRIKRQADIYVSSLRELLALSSTSSEERTVLLTTYSNIQFEKDIDLRDIPEVTKRLR